MRGRHASIAVVAAAAVALTACGAGAGDGDAATGPASLTIGIGSGATFAPLTTDAASDGLQITTQTVGSAAAAIPLLLNGQLQFTAADTAGALTAISQGVPLVIVALAASAGTSPDNDATGVLVRPDGSIRTAADLAGKNVAVNGIGSSAQVFGAAGIDEAGGDSSAVNFIEVPPPAMVAAIQAGTVDAAILSEPGVTAGTAAGLQNLFAPTSAALPSAPLFVYVTSQSYLAENPEVVDRFARNIATANTFASENPDVVRAYAAESVQLTPEQLEKMILPQFAPNELDKPAMQRVVDLMVTYQVIDKPVDLDTAMYTP